MVLLASMAWCQVEENPLGWDGFYTDKASYQEGEVVFIHGNWAIPGVGGQPDTPRTVRYRVSRVAGIDYGAMPMETVDWHHLDLDELLTFDHLYSIYEEPPFGSFVRGFRDENSGVDFSMEGWTAGFTVAMWVYPEGSVPDRSQGNLAENCLVGHAGLDSAGIPIGTYLGTNPDGDLVAQLSLTDGSTIRSRRVTDTVTPLDAGRWHFVAMTYDGSELKLFHRACNVPSKLRDGFTACGCLTDGNPAPDTELFSMPSGVVSTSGLEFRVGARNEAPGDLTGCFNGRVDELRIWPFDLSAAQLQDLMRKPGVDEAQSCPGTGQRLPGGLVLDVPFDDAYGVDVGINNPLFERRVRDDVSGGDVWGTVFNHGTPGLTGIMGPGDYPPHTDDLSYSLGLQHDQVIDALYDQEIAVFSTEAFESGFYVIEALFKTGPGEWNVDDPINSKSNHFASFVVTPSEGAPKADIAAIVPVMTWVTYNAWPGNQGTKSRAKGLSPRFDVGGSEVPQGNNSSYGEFYYSGWNRPSPRASVFVDAPDDDKVRNEFDAFLDGVMIGWLEEPGSIGGMQQSGFEVDYYSDWELHENPELLDEYDTVVLMAHPEYSSLKMMNSLHRFTDCFGGSILSIGGNSLIWRGELATSYDSYVHEGAAGVSTNEVVEVRKWPELDKMLGVPDAHSCMVPPDDSTPYNPAGRAGAWRWVEQMHPGGYRLRDTILGTTTDVGGIPKQPGDSCPEGLDFSKFGEWMLSGSDHWLTAGLIAGTPLSGLGRVVGNEFDRYVCKAILTNPAPPTVTSDCLVAQALLPPFAFDPAGPQSFDDAFPYSAGGTARILGNGVNFNGDCSYNYLLWCSLAGSLTNFETVDDLAGSGLKNFYVKAVPATLPWRALEGHGNIVYYEHVGGGRVLTIASIASPLGLIAANDSLRTMAHRFLQCTAFDIGCNATGNGAVPLQCPDPASIPGYVPNPPGTDLNCPPPAPSQGQ